MYRKPDWYYINEHDHLTIKMFKGLEIEAGENLYQKTPFPNAGLILSNSYNHTTIFFYRCLASHAFKAIFIIPCFFSETD